MADPAGTSALATLPLDRIAAMIPPAPPDVRPGRAEIAAVVEAIVRAVRPAQIVLFGSRAYGSPTPESDVDLMVVMDDPPDRERIRRAIPRDVARASRIQVHVRRPAQIALGLAEGDFFIEDVMLKGIALYRGSGMDGTRATLGDGSSNGAGDKPRLKAATRDWLRKADGDAQSASILLAADAPNPDVVCFLAQQCAEKCLKALLQERGIRFPRTHDLVALAALAAPLAAELTAHKADLEFLGGCAVDPRYPGHDVTPEQAEAAVQTMTTVRELVRTALGLET